MTNSTDRGLRKAYILSFLIIIILLPVICHLRFSSLGFNPSDDGFILSGSKRMLLGEVPHRDFITIRPLLPYLLHIPEIIFGGDSAFWLSRFIVWIQFASIAWLSVFCASVLLKRRLSVFQMITFSLIAFIFTVHDFPLMAWYSIDAVFFSFLGLAFCLSRSEKKKMLGYFLIGLTPLSRQNFLLLAPVLLLLLNDFQKFRYWIASFLPLFLMGGYLLMTGAFFDAIVQMTTHTELITVGVLKYYRTKAFLRGVFLGLVGTYLLLGKLNIFSLPKGMQSAIGRLLFFIGGILAALWMMPPESFYGTGSFLLFGMVAGSVLYLFLQGRQYFFYARAGGVFLAIAWSVSVSLGYNTPALASAGLVAFLLFLIVSSRHTLLPDVVKTGGMLFLLFLFLPQFISLRENKIYREAPANQLTYSLDGIFPGGKHLRTNVRVYTFLQDFSRAQAKAGGKEIIVLPDLAAYWVASHQKNPLSIDWPDTVELGTQPLVERIWRDLEQNKGKRVVLLQKIRADQLGTQYYPMDDGYSPVILFMKKHYKKFAETQFFELYR